MTGWRVGLFIGRVNLFSLLWCKFKFRGRRSPLSAAESALGGEQIDISSYEFNYYNDVDILVTKSAFRPGRDYHRAGLGLLWASDS